MGNCFTKETDEEKNEKLLVKLQEKIEKLHIINEEMERKNKEEFLKLHQQIEEQKAIINTPWINYSSVPKRRMRLTKSASKRKSKKTRSQHAKKTKKY